MIGLDCAGWKKQWNQFFEVGSYHCIRQILEIWHLALIQDFYLVAELHVKVSVDELEQWVVASALEFPCKRNQT